MSCFHVVDHSPRHLKFGSRELVLCQCHDTIRLTSLLAASLQHSDLDHFRCLVVISELENCTSICHPGHSFCLWNERYAIFSLNSNWGSLHRVSLYSENRKAVEHQSSEQYADYWKLIWMASESVCVINAGLQIVWREEGCQPGTPSIESTMRWGAWWNKGVFSSIRFGSSFSTVTLWWPLLEICGAYILKEEKERLQLLEHPNCLRVYL